MKMKKRDPSIGSPLFLFWVERQSWRASAGSISPAGYYYYYYFHWGGSERAGLKARLPSHLFLRWISVNIYRIWTLAHDANKRWSPVGSNPNMVCHFHRCSAYQKRTNKFFAPKFRNHITVFKFWSRGFVIQYLAPTRRYSPSDWSSRKWSLLVVLPWKRSASSAPIK